LTEIRNTGSGAGLAGGTRRRLDYAYADAPSETTDAKRAVQESNNLVSVKNARSQEVLSIDYDDPQSFGAKEAAITRRIAGIAETFSYDSAAMTTTYTDRRGHNRTFVHDDNGHATSVTLAVNDTNDVNGSGAPGIALPGGTVLSGPFETKTDFESKDGLTQKVTLPSGRTVSYDYESAGSTDRRNRANVAAETATGSGVASPQKDQYAYQDLTNSVKSHTDPTGAVTTYDRDPQKGFVNKVTEPNSIGLSGATPTPGMNITHDDSTGQPKAAADFAGVGTLFTYFDKPDPAYGYLQS